MDTLETELGELRRQVKENELTQENRQQIERIRRSGILERIPQVGDIAPDFRLPDSEGNTICLHEKAKEGPVILSFYRGKWCPFCDLELRALQRYLTEFSRYGASLIGISPQRIAFSQLTQKEKNISFTIVSDAGNQVAQRYSLLLPATPTMETAFRSFGLDLGSMNSDQSFNLPVPGTFVVGQDAKIIFAYANADFTKRAEPADILAQLMHQWQDRFA